MQRKVCRLRLAQDLATVLSRLIVAWPPCSAGWLENVRVVLNAGLDVHLLRYGQGALNLDTEVSDRTFQLGMPE